MFFKTYLPDGNNVYGSRGGELEGIDRGITQVNLENG